MAPTPSKPPKPPPKTVADFLILPLTLPSLTGLPASACAAKHFLYVKPHAPRMRAPEDERSLFVANVPVDAGEGGLRALFAGVGGGAMVERVVFDGGVYGGRARAMRGDERRVGGGTDGKAKRKREVEDDVLAARVLEDADTALPQLWASSVKKTASAAVVVFVDRKSCRGAWTGVKEVVKKGGHVQWTTDLEMGVARYKSHLTLTYPAPTPLLSTITSYAARFSALEAVRARRRKRARSAPDEDGFTTVVRGGRAGPARVEAAEKKKAELEERRKGVARDDFYRFQNRERRKGVEGELRRRFEEDRRRVVEGRGRGRGVPEV